MKLTLIVKPKEGFQSAVLDYLNAAELHKRILRHYLRPPTSDLKFLIFKEDD